MGSLPKSKDNRILGRKFAHALGCDQHVIWGKMPGDFAL